MSAVTVTVVFLKRKLVGKLKLCRQYHKTAREHPNAVSTVAASVHGVVLNTTELGICGPRVLTALPLAIRFHGTIANQHHEIHRLVAGKRQERIRRDCRLGSS
jgi:hypothetical protein